MEENQHGDPTRLNADSRPHTSPVYRVKILEPIKKAAGRGAEQARRRHCARFKSSLITGTLFSFIYVPII
jgi:hypothetical protein